MIKRKIITTILPLLLLILFSNNVKSEVFMTSAKQHYAISLSLKDQTSISPAFDDYGLSFNRHIVKKYKLTVRYMGGECSYGEALIPLKTKLPEFVENKVSIWNCFFIPSDNHFLFKLRGPPSATGIYTSRVAPFTV